MSNLHIGTSALVQFEASLVRHRIWHTSARRARDKAHFRKLASDIGWLVRVSPALSFKFVMNTCSIAKSVLIATKQVLLRRTFEYPPTSFAQTSGCFTLTRCMSCRYSDTVFK